MIHKTQSHRRNIILLISLSLIFILASLLISNQNKLRAQGAEGGIKFITQVTPTTAFYGEETFFTAGTNLPQTSDGVEKCSIPDQKTYWMEGCYFFPGNFNNWSISVPMFQDCSDPTKLYASYSYLPADQGIQETWIGCNPPIDVWTVTPVTVEEAPVSAPTPTPVPPPAPTPKPTPAPTTIPIKTPPVLDCPAIISNIPAYIKVGKNKSEKAARLLTVLECLRQ